MIIRTRIAPSPTGLFHIGTARTALFNYLFAKRYGGKFILRIEDTDHERSKPEFENDIFEGLKWLGIAPDEDPLGGGLFGPYRQSERTEKYQIYLEKLLSEGNAFYCFHSEKELAVEQDRWTAERKQAFHECEYRNTPLKEGEQIKKEKKSFVIRFKTPAGVTVMFRDLIRGEVSFETSFVGDFSIAKDITVPLYNFAVVVDDELMKISHVIRGEDHISNTPKQLLLIEALGFSRPQYAHLPLILGADRSKLSKRHGAISLNEFREQGYLREAMINFMAFLGWNPGGERELFSLAELENEFSFEKVQKAGAVFNQEKLDWFNAHYIKQKTIDELTQLCAPYFNPESRIQNPEFLKKIVALEQPRLKKLSDIKESTQFFFKEAGYDATLLAWKDSAEEKTIRALECAKTLLERIADPFEKIKLQDVFFAEIDKSFQGKGELLWPLRVALSGKKTSPSPFEIIEILGREESLRRVNGALMNLKRR
ncbi:MAG: glutamate--tRNA ligase [Patescibacteria group bacterium]